MKNTKREMNFFSIHDRTGMQKHLEDMASKGWMLEKVEQYFWYYRRAEARRIKFAVSYFPSASTFDYAPSDKQETYREFCEHAGWKFAGGTAQLQIYWNEDQNAVPIETDPLVELDTIHRSAKKTIVVSNIVLILCAFLQIARCVSAYKNNLIYTLLDDANLIGTLLFLFGAAFCVSELVFYYKWYVHAKKVAETEGSFVETKSRTQTNKILLGILAIAFIITMMTSEVGPVVGLIIMGYTAVIFAIVFGIKNILKEMQVPTNTNRIVTFIACFIVTIIVTSISSFFIIRNWDLFKKDKHNVVGTYEQEGWVFDIYGDELPLYIDDLLDLNGMEYSYKRQEKESIFLKQIEGYQEVAFRSDEYPYLYYQVLTVKNSKLFEVCKNEEIKEASKYDKERKYVEVAADLWKANEAYQLYGGEEARQVYLICYDDTIVTISFINFELEENFPQIISEKLKPN